MTNELLAALNAHGGRTLEEKVEGLYTDLKNTIILFSKKIEDIEYNLNNKLPLLEKQLRELQKNLDYALPKGPVNPPSIEPKYNEKQELDYSTLPPPPPKPAKRVISPRGELMSELEQELEKRRRKELSE